MHIILSGFVLKLYLSVVARGQRVPIQSQRSSFGRDVVPGSAVQVADVGCAWQAAAIDAIDQTGVESVGRLSVR